MIHIDPISPKIISARNQFLDEMVFLIISRIEKITKITNINTSIARRFFELYIDDNLEDILIGFPEDIQKINKTIQPFIDISNDFEVAIKYVFNYDWFIDKCTKRFDAYNLAESLDIITCTYCNRIYTNTVVTKSNKKVIRPQFDHFFDKDSNPLLALSFYNLIPSCSICNSNIKHGKKFDLSTHIHPYIDNVIDDFNFTYDYTNKNKSGLKIVVDTIKGSRAERTFNDMAVETVYNAHINELKDLLDLKSKFSDRYLSILSSNILGPSIETSQEELYRLAFGTEFQKEDFYKRPFSKFKNDILRELNII
jgi:hypothetical protein